MDINENGEVAGYDAIAEVSFGSLEILGAAPVVWRSAATPPARLFGVQPGCDEFSWSPHSGREDPCAAMAAAINDAGAVAGSIGTRAFRRTSGGQLDTLSLPGSSGSSGINRRGDVSGFVEAEDPAIPEKLERAFVWSRTGSIQLLGTLPRAISARANAINDLGQVVGYAY